MFSFAESVRLLTTVPESIDVCSLIYPFVRSLVDPSSMRHSFVRSHSFVCSFIGNCICSAPCARPSVRLFLKIWSRTASKSSHNSSLRDFLWRLRTTPATTLSRSFREVFVQFFPRELPKKIFGNDSFHRRDRFRQIFVQIGAILAIFQPFELFGR